MKKCLCITIFMVLFVMLLPPVYAQNNKFGISLLQPTSEDVLGASTLVNSNGGGWGYVTLVIQENDRDVHKWQDLFEELREKKLIPIVRLATQPEGEVWRRPEAKDADSWVAFLNKLNWVVKKRYIVLFNEPNHATEWGGEVDPVSYGNVAKAFAQKLSGASSDYVIMLAGLDAAAPQSSTQYYDSEVFLREMCQSLSCPDLFSSIAGWASHSYPNPGFSGSVWDTGKKSIRGYAYELALLAELGVTKQLPVFITETGWTKGVLSEATIAENYRIAFEQVWGPDERVVAVTPFVFSYLGAPFIGFSWRNETGYTAQYEVVKNLQKKEGEPVQEEKGFIEFTIPERILVDSTYHFSIHLKNEGQAIWTAADGYHFVVTSRGEAPFTLLLPDIGSIKPFEEETVEAYIKTGAKPQTYSFALALKRNDTTIRSSTYKSGTLEALPSLVVSTKIFPKMVSNGDQFELQIFDSKQELIMSKKGLSMRSGQIRLDRLVNAVPGDTYRVVILGYPYLPRQNIFTLHKGENTIKLKQLLPFDVNGNGHFDVGDFTTLLHHPDFTLRFIPWR